MFLVLIFKENGLFTLLKLGFASQNCGCTLMLQEKLKASPKLEPPAKSAPLKSIKPPEWPSPPSPPSDLYNWKTNHPLSQDPQRLTGLVEFLMFSHQPT